MESSIIFSLNGEDVNHIVEFYNKFNSNIPLEIGEIKVQNFSDSEMSVQFLNSIRGKKTYLYTTLGTSDHILKTCLAIDAAKKGSASEIILIQPCLPYSRSDKKEFRGSLGSKVIANLLQVNGLNRLITCELHAQQIQGFYDCPVDHLEGHNLFISYICKLIDENIISKPTILSPDAGGVPRSDKYFRKLKNIYPILGVTFAMCSKIRDKPNSIGEMTLIGDVNGRDVILTDDIFDTFGTAKKAIDILFENGATSVRTISSHGIFSGKAAENINDSKVDEIIVSDSHQFNIDINKKLTIISYGEMIAKTIHAVNNGISASEILDI